MKWANNQFCVDKWIAIEHERGQFGLLFFWRKFAFKWIFARVMDSIQNVVFATANTPKQFQSIDKWILLVVQSLATSSPLVRLHRKNDARIVSQFLALCRSRLYNPKRNLHHALAHVPFIVRDNVRAPSNQIRLYIYRTFQGHGRISLNSTDSNHLTNCSPIFSILFFTFWFARGLTLSSFNWCEIVCGV